LLLTKTLPPSELQLQRDNQSLNLGSYNLTLNGTTSGFIFNGGGNYSITGTGAQGFNVAGNAAYLYVNSDTLTISANFTKSSSTGDLTKAGDGLLVISGNYSHQNNYSLGVDKGSNGGDDMQIAGKISGAQTLIKTGLGTLALTGSGDNAAYGAGFQIVAGTLALDKATQELQNTALGTGMLTFNGGAFAARNFAATLSNAIGLVNGTNVANEIKGDMPITFLGAVRGGAYLGQTYILVNNSTANLTINGNVSAWSSGYSGIASTSTIDFSGSGNTIINGIVEDVALGVTALKKQGTGLLTLSGINTYTGSTLVWGGYLRLDNANALSGAFLEITSQAYSGYADAVVELGVGNTNFTRAIGTGAGNVDLGGANNNGLNTAGFASVTGTAIVNLGGAGAALSWGSIGFFRQGGSLVLGSPNVAGTVDFQNALSLGGNRTIIALNGSADVDGIVSGIISGNTNRLTKDGNGTLALTAANTYTGSTTISAGTLQVGNGGTTGSLATGSAIVNNATLAFKRSDAISQGTDFNSVISGTGAVIQAGSGNLTLNGVNTYTGKTIISAGTLLLGAGGTIANSSEINLGTLASQGRLDLTAKSDFTFGAGQTVSGYGTIDIGLGKTVTVAGNLAPGNSPGILSVVGSLALSGTTTMEINGATTAGVDYDQVSLSGSLTNGGNLVLSFGSAFSGGPITLFQAAGIYSGSFAGVTGTGHYGTLTFDQSGNVWTSGDLSFDQSTGVFTAVPEPSTWLLLALAGVLAVFSRFPLVLKKKAPVLVCLLGASAGFCQHAQAQLTWLTPNKADADTLVLYHMDEKGLTLKDSGPNTLDATLGDIVSRSGEPSAWLTPPAGAYLLPTGDKTTGTTGVTGNVVVRDVDFSKGLTISMWYRAVPDEAQGGELFQIENPRVRVATDDFGAGKNGRLVMLAPGKNGGGKQPMADFGSLDDWRHVAVVFDPVNATAEDGGTWSFYLDNELVGSINDTSDLSATVSFPLRIGGNVFNNGPLQGGCIDELLLSNRVITDFSHPAGL
jgi:autotransporter-associated beta strand protein